jgi:hypothetical protein
MYYFLNLQQNRKLLASRASIDVNMEDDLCPLHALFPVLYGGMDACLEIEEF